MPAVKAVAKEIGASTTKLRPIIGLVRGKRVDEALDILSLVSSPWGRVVAKVVKSASANAENNLLLDPNNLRITKIVADEAKPLRRMRPHARGRAGRLRKPFSHITVIVDEEGV